MRAWSAIALTVAVSACLTLEARAAQSDTMLVGTIEEQAALTTMETGKLIKARELAEAILDAHPDSFIAGYVMSAVFQHEEANHPRALFVLRAVKRQLERRFSDRPQNPQAAIWHKRILMDEVDLLGQIDDRLGQLAVLDYYDDRYSPKLTKHRIWPLMKLERYDEAREAAREVTLSPSVYDRISGFNGMMALEDERLDRRASYRWGTEGVAATSERSCVLLSNNSDAALNMFEYAAAEAYAKKSFKADIKDCPNPSYEHLTTLNLLQARFQLAVSSLEKLARYPIDKRYRSQFAMNNRTLLNELLFALGKFEEAAKFAEMVFMTPDRTGMRSTSVHDDRFHHGVVLWVLTRMRIERLREAGSVRGLLNRLDKEVEIATLRLRQWEVERILLQLAVRSGLLVTNLRPYLRGVKPWYAGHIAEILGTGLARAAVTRARELDLDVDERAKGFFVALQGEIAWRDGDDADAARLGRQALESLPVEEKLLRWRVRSWLADLAWRNDDPASARRHWREVVHHYPTALRHLSIRLPAAIHHDGDPFSVRVAERLLDSRRLDEGDAGFRVDVATIDDRVQICLMAADGFRFGCSDSELDTKSADEESAAIDAFHDTVFSPKVELTQTDINSLDGSTMRRGADEVLKGLLGDPAARDKRDGGEP